jgi:hypothetical protein
VKVQEDQQKPSKIKWMVDDRHAYKDIDLLEIRLNVFAPSIPWHPFSTKVCSESLHKAFSVKYSRPLDVIFVLERYK